MSAFTLQLCVCGSGNIVKEGRGQEDCKSQNTRKLSVNQSVPETVTQDQNNGCIKRHCTAEITEKISRGPLPRLRTTTKPNDC